MNDSEMFVCVCGSKVVFQNYEISVSSIPDGTDMSCVPGLRLLSYKAVSVWVTVFETFKGEVCFRPKGNMCVVTESF